jgi:hypothetical protein
LNFLGILFSRLNVQAESCLNFIIYEKFFIPDFSLSFSPVQLIAKQDLDQNDPKRHSKERQGIDQLQNKPAKPAEIFYQVIREVDPRLIQPVKNQVENAPATKPYKSSKNIINNFHNIIDPTVWSDKKFPSGFLPPEQITMLYFALWISAGSLMRPLYIRCV